MFRSIILILGIALSGNISSAYQKHISNEKPLIKRNSLELFSKEMSIPNDGGDEYYIYSISGITIDDQNNVFVIDWRDKENHIKMFDSSGRFVRAFGENGQGPNEFDTPRTIVFHDNKFFVFDRALGIKIFNNNWEYLNIARFFNFEEETGVYTLDGMIYYMKSNTKVHDVMKLNFESNKPERLITFKEPEIKGDGFYSPRTFAVDSKKNFFYVRDSEKYIIEKYYSDGELSFTFGREYERKPFSKKTRDYHNNYFKRPIESGKMNPLSKYPAVIRKILIDDHDLLWVITGEWKLDGIGGAPIVETVDVFTTEGKYVYSFESDLFGPISKFSRDRLLSIMLRDPETGDQTINMYKIDYSKLTKK